MSTSKLAGVLAPVITPFDARFRPDAKRFIAHCQWLLERDVGLSPFGSSSEGNSLSVEEKIDLLDQLVDAGLPPSKMMPGTGCCALPDSIRLTRRAVELGCAGVLMLPPFFYKGLSDDDLYGYFSEVIESVGDSSLKIYLYHIPHVSNVPITLTLIERLLKDFPANIAGTKDSSGDWDNMRAVLENFQPQGFDMFTGHDDYLLATLRMQGKGCILGSANFNPRQSVGLYRDFTGDDAERQQEALSAVWAVIQSYPVFPAMKAALAGVTGDRAWRRPRPPLSALDDSLCEQMYRALNRAGLDMENA
jgi:4-hydroxy-tetrahydrodipicolinate synthase